MREGSITTMRTEWEGCRERRRWGQGQRLIEVEGKRKGEMVLKRSGICEVIEKKGDELQDEREIVVMVEGRANEERTK